MVADDAAQADAVVGLMETTELKAGNLLRLLAVVEAELLLVMLRRRMQSLV